MLELIIALFLSLGIVTDANDVSDQLIQQHQNKIESHIIDDDYIIE